MMMRLFLTPVFVLASALAAQAGQLSLGEISSYLNALKTAEAEFTQINDDGTIATGTIIIKRPGRARFEYNPPEKTLVVVGNNQVAIFDGKSNTGLPESYPLKQTPLNLILGRNIDLGTADMVMGHEYDGTATAVIAQDPENPEYGYIRLMFTADPVELRQWIITDGQGAQTTVILGEMTKGGSFSNRLFDAQAETVRIER